MSTANPTPEKDQPVNPQNGMAAADRLWPWYVVTAIYIIGCSIILFDRATEFGDFFEPADGAPGRLRLNEIGDIAAGIFAPLAFLWLFIATQLQRKELRLQHAELAETRNVLAGQQLELEKAAEESNRQTAIMRDTLKSATTRSSYESFSYILYLICRRAYLANDWYFKTRSGSIQLLKFQPDLYLSENDNSVLDTFIEKLHKNISYFRNRHMTDEDTPVFEDRDTRKTIATLRFLSESLSNITQESEFKQNDLVRLRIEGIPFASLIDEIKFFVEWCDKFDPDIFTEEE
ncbi:UNVERIFIED_ORG: hypothetical protein M2438_003447 [Methylobacterium sp. SuP10 SLI 274]|uniref:hypothetical protein n=1 Tax=Methylorubrum extorquens TaxID=408 RepID=UPI00209F6A5A|nr:hypothetical protein [Methylorubrum extorquens]MCP1559353.1 hypothetical protein [Methylorubrum extorquens]MDF9792996.1 hypothetical protein [Methylorubrum extorquens]MDF9864688.1 hypothetical protein [Methylorubrum pseudosasae]MDH6638272.1 hypothetical protein [Methylobacterium sp. SuP10 SLI 274]